MFPYWIQWINLGAYFSLFTGLLQVRTFTHTFSQKAVIKIVIVNIFDLVLNSILIFLRGENNCC